MAVQPSQVGLPLRGQGASLSSSHRSPQSSAPGSEHRLRAWPGMPCYQLVSSHLACVTALCVKRQKLQVRHTE
jgi:hypothetical protein